MKETFNIRARDLISTTRFDVIVKYLYANSYLKGYETDYFLEMYKHHLWLWGGGSFREYDKPEKNTFEIFKSVFDNLIEDISKNGFDESKSSIPVSNKKILNGSHRLAASIPTNAEVSCYEGTNGVDGQLNCDWLFFKNLGFRPDYADRVALEFTKIIVGARF